MLFFFLLALFVNVSSVFSQDSIPDSIVKPTLKNYDYAYDHRIKTVRCRAENSRYVEAVISLSGSKLLLEFDDLSDDYIEYRYEIVHCDRAWRPDELTLHDYYEGFSSNIIEDYEFSNATKTEYTHYSLRLPKNGERFLRSGNYLIHIYEAESGRVVLTRRFMVVEPKVSISGEVKRSSDVRYRDYKQQITFEVHDPNSNLEDIGHIYVRIHKNHAWDIYCDSLKASFVSNNKIVFDRLDGCTFDGGNEYRYFNMIEFRNISNNIIKVDRDLVGRYSLWLDLDESRSYLSYSVVEDWNGKAIYTSDLKTFISNELDYAHVHFRLKTDDYIPGNEIYVFGELSDFRLNDQFKMTYNAEKEWYELNSHLKQGLYNYQYVVKSIYQKEADESFIEGSHFDTENDYTIYLYYYNAFEGVDELLGIERINSRVFLDE